LPGPGSIYLLQELRFLVSLYIGDTLTTRVEVQEIIEDKNRVCLKTIYRNQDETIVIRWSHLGDATQSY